MHPSLTPADGRAMTKEDQTPQRAASATTNPLSDGRQSAAALDIARGVQRLLASLGFASLPEVTLANNRRADLIAIGPKGEIWIVEIKSGLADFQADHKWPEYLEYCDRFYFAIDARFPIDVLPVDTGLIMADRFGAEIMRETQLDKLAAARRRVVHVLAARVGAARLQRLVDPEASLEAVWPCL